MGFVRRTVDAIKRWYEGPYVRGKDTAPWGDHVPHWTAKIVRSLVESWRKHWQFWLLAALNAVAALAALWQAQK